MLPKRIIPCLDVADGRVVKGVKFAGLRDAGDPQELAAVYSEAGADELVFLDISATVQKRRTMLQWVAGVAAEVSIPLTVGGGIESPAHVRDILRSGADKVSINTAAVRDPALIDSAAAEFGRQCIVVAIDARRLDSAGELSWEVRTHGGSQSADMDALEWAERAVELGAGELLVTSVDRDGTTSGYDVELIAELHERVPVPIIASGGAGGPEDMLAAFEAGADAALAASIFHYGDWSVRGVKEFLSDAGVEVRL